MGPVGIEFEWERDAKGYRKAEEAPSPNNALRILIGAPQIRFPENLPMPQSTGPEDALYVVRNGGTLIRYRADEDLDQIFREFVNTPPSADGAVAFANRWGQLVGP